MINTRLCLGKLLARCLHVSISVIAVTLLFSANALARNTTSHVSSAVASSAGTEKAAIASGPHPLLKDGTPVDWWFVFKLNAKIYPQCGAGAPARRCLFGGELQPYPMFGQQYLFASSASSTLEKSSPQCVGMTDSDPVGATFKAIYTGNFYYVTWNDQFYDHPTISGCSKSCGAPWGHSKGILAWDDGGNGLVIQVTTPSWPGAGSQKAPRRDDGNTLGCVIDNNVKVSQHFFALRLSKDDVLIVLSALQNASVVTDINKLALVKNGGPPDIQALVNQLGKKSESKAYQSKELSSHVRIISKPSALNVPPWQMVSAILKGTPLRTATWWASPRIYTSTDATQIRCWDESLPQPGAVEIATTGQFDGTVFGLQGGLGADFNHAKIGVSIGEEAAPITVFGDMNQQGAINGNCERSQNGRGGLFFVLTDKPLHDSVRALISGDTAPTRAPKQ